MALLIVLLVPICSFAPGFFLVRRLRWDPLEKVTASLGLSLVFLYLAALGIYAAHLPWKVTWVVTAACVAAAVATRNDIVRLFRNRGVRRCLAWFGVLFGFNLLMLSVVRHYVGGYWWGDWAEHYERALYFLDFGPKDHRFIGIYLLPARPPLMNLVCSFFLAQVGRGFEAFQFVNTFMNLLMFLPCVLLARWMAPRGARYVGLIATLFALNPMFVENAEFTWTKAAVSFYVALGLALYLAAWRKKDPVRMGAAFFSLAAGCLLHYSAGPFAVLLALHYLVFVFPHRPQRWRELASIVLPSAALLATWFSLAIARYGLADTVLSNTTAQESGRLTFTENLSKIALNIFDTLVPSAIRDQPGPAHNSDTLRRLVDGAFYFYQVNLPFAIGSVAWLVALVLFALAVWPRPGGLSRGDRVFWMILVVGSIVLGIATHGARDHFGVAHIGLQPFVAIAVTFVAAKLPRVPRMLRGVILTGLALDFIMGVAIHLYMESRLDGWATDGNLPLKQAGGIDRVFIGDDVSVISGPLLALCCIFAAGLLAYAFRVLARLPETAVLGSRHPQQAVAGD
jgi:hypothetical protein